MKVLLEHIRYQTVPHDMLDELKQAGIKFYESLFFCYPSPCVKLTLYYRLSYSADP